MEDTPEGEFPFGCTLEKCYSLSICITWVFIWGPSKYALDYPFVFESLWPQCIMTNSHLFSLVKKGRFLIRTNIKGGKEGKRER